MTAEHATTDTTSLARAILAGRDFALCPILADAMQDAGCNSGDLDVLRAATVFGRPPILAEVGRICAGLLGVRVVRVGTHDTRTGRLRARTVNAEAVAETAAHRAVFLGRAWNCTHGGGVPNSYGYAATTEGALAAAVYDAAAGVVRVLLMAGELPANKVRTAGVAALWGYRDLCDQRVSAERKAAAAERLFAEVTA